MTILLLIGLALAAVGAFLRSRGSRLLGLGSLAIGLLLAAWALVAIDEPDPEALPGSAVAPLPPALQHPRPAPAPAGEASRIVVCPGDPRCPKQ